MFWYRNCDCNRHGHTVPCYLFLSLIRHVARFFAMSWAFNSSKPSHFNCSHNISNFILWIIIALMHSCTHTHKLISQLTRFKLIKMLKTFRFVYLLHFFHWFVFDSLCQLCRIGISFVSKRCICALWFV